MAIEGIHVHFRSILCNMSSRSKKEHAHVLTAIGKGEILNNINIDLKALVTLIVGYCTGSHSELIMCEIVPRFHILHE